MKKEDSLEALGKLDDVSLSILVEGIRAVGRIIKYLSENGVTKLAAEKEKAAELLRNISSQPGVSGLKTDFLYLLVSKAVTPRSQAVVTSINSAMDMITEAGPSEETVTGEAKLTADEI